MKRLVLVCLLLICLSALSQSQTITVTSPNGGEDWALGSTHMITWRSTGLTGTVNILLFNGTQRVGAIANDVPVTAGPFSWVVGRYQGGTAAPGTNYKVRVRKPQTEVMDDSDRRFTISGGTPPAGALSVASPNGGETWTTNAAHEVRWTSSGISGKVTIRLKKGGAVIKSWTAENTGSSYGSYSEFPAGTDYRIRVESADGSVFDESNRDFSIQALPGPTPPPPSGQIRNPQQAQMTGTLKTPPRITAFRLNNGAEVVDDLLVTFNYTCLGGPTHFRYGIDPPSAWNDWQAIVPGQAPSGYLLIVGCEQTVHFQLKNEYGESNVVSDSIKTSTYRTARTISIVEALKYARPQGFTDGVIWADCQDCTKIVGFPDGGIQFQLGYLDPGKNQTGGMKADFELFGGGKLLKPGWEFVSFGMADVVSVGNPDALDAQGVRISHQPSPGGRDIRLQARLWRNILSGSVILDVRTITIKGPCTEDISEAFKQQ